MSRSARAHRLVGEVLLLVVAQLARAVGHRAALGATTLREVIEVPIAYSWTIEREISATRCRSSDGARGDRAEHDLLGGAPAEQHRHVVDQLLARLEVAVLLGEVERVAERPAARDDRDLVHAVDAGQQLGAQRVAGLVEGDDAALVLVERAARLHAGDDALERGVEVGLREPVAARRARRRSPPRCRGWPGRRR